MLSPPFPACPNKLACVGLVSHVAILSEAIRHGTLPQSRLAQPGSPYFILFYFILFYFILFYFILFYFILSVQIRGYPGV